MAKSVRILNPLPGCARRTSFKKATHYVAQHRARFSECGKHIEFIGEDHRHQMVAMLLAMEQAVGRRQAACEGEQERTHRLITRMLRLDELRRIPCLQAEQALVLATRPRRSGYRNGKPRSVLAQYGQAIGPDYQRGCKQ